LNNWPEFKYAVSFSTKTTSKQLSHSGIKRDIFVIAGACAGHFIIIAIVVIAVKCKKSKRFIIYFTHKHTHTRTHTHARTHTHTLLIFYQNLIKTDFSFAFS